MESLVSGVQKQKYSCKQLFQRKNGFNSTFANKYTNYNSLNYTLKRIWQLQLHYNVIVSINILGTQAQ